MKLTNLKIGTQLRLGLGLIAVLVLALGVLAWVQADLLWQQTKGLYEHPLTVRRALDKLTIDILFIQRHMKDLVLTEHEAERQPLIQGIDTYEADVFLQFNTLYDRYLGPQRDLDVARTDFIQWKSIREETLRLLRAGKISDAVARTKSGGASGAQVEKLWGHVQKISVFAQNRGDRFYRDAEAQKNALTRQLAVIVAAILLLALAIAWLLLKGIRTPIKELTAVAEQLRGGKMDTRCNPMAANELGALSATFNAMADAIQQEQRINENAAQLAGVMLREDEAQAFCHELLTALLQHTGSQVGAVYVLNDERTAFEHFASIGLGAGGRAAFSATEQEGELGTVLATRHIQHLTAIPTDTRFTFAAVSGTFMPREILTIPVLSDHSVAAIISLASVHAYDAPTLRLVNEIWSVLTARVNGVLAFRKVTNLAEQLNHQNHELEAQKRELAVQTDELTHQNTELEMQKRQLDEANRLKSAFLSNMSHELRTPLNSVIALSGVLNRRLANTIPVEEYGYLEIIERNGKNLLALINDILDLSRIEAGREEITFSRFSVRELADEIVAMLDPQARDKNLTLTNRIGNDLPPLTSDFDKCRHILQNLVGNAVKFTPAGAVEITARQADDAVFLTVHDTGIGIAADQLPHIFDEFRQADDSTSRKFGGTGLGLAIAKKYALLLGGSVTVTSTPGHGSTFTLRLPLTLTDAAPTAESDRPDVGHAAGSAPVAPGQGQNILLVEDNEPAIIQLTDLLHAAGYRVQAARNGKEGLAMIAQTLPDAMILDLMMPEVDGFEVLKAIRGTERAGQLPVLILTAKHVTKEELSFLKGNHIHQLIQKGDINKQDLLAAVARMVAPTPPPSTAQPLNRPTPQPPNPSTPQPPNHPTPQPPNRPTARAGKPVILVVEDNPDNLRTANALLCDHYQVISATDGQAGVEQARQHQPDLILTDLALPVMDGFAELTALRNDETVRHIPVVAVTASAMKGHREEILAHGFDAYISKPIDHDTLMKTLRELLD